MTDVPTLLAQGRAVLAAFTDTSGMNEAFDVALWAGTNLAALINALEATLRERDDARGVLACIGPVSGYAVVVAHQEPGWPPVVDDTNTSLEYAEDARRRLTRQHSRAYRVCELREVES